MVFKQGNIPHNKNKITSDNVSLVPKKHYQYNKANGRYYKRQTKEIKCLNCRKIKPVNLKAIGLYCSVNCQLDYQAKKYIENLDNNKGLTNKSKRTSNHLYTYLKKKNKHYLEVLKITPCCKIPLSNFYNQGFNVDTGKLAIMELNHINHNSRDNRLINLELICSNCHRVKTLSPFTMKKLGLIGRIKYQNENINKYNKF